MQAECRGKACFGYAEAQPALAAGQQQSTLLPLFHFPLFISSQKVGFARVRGGCFMIYGLAFPSNKDGCIAEGKSLNKVMFLIICK